MCQTKFQGQISTKKAIKISTAKSQVNVQDKCFENISKSIAKIKFSKKVQLQIINFEIKKVQLLKEHFAMYGKLCNTKNVR